jgi:hypothetical protein
MEELNISIINISNRAWHISGEELITGQMIPMGSNSPPAEISTK